MLAVETISGACPSKYLVQWLRDWSMRDAETNQTVGPDERPVWWKLLATPQGDLQQLRTFIDNGSAEEVVLIQRAVADSRLRKDEKFRVSAKVTDNASRRARAQLQSVLELKGSDGMPAGELSTLLGEQVAGLDFDDGWVVLATDEGKRQVSPSRTPDVFTYPIADERPGGATFKSEVMTHLQPLLTSMDATLDWSGWL